MPVLNNVMVRPSFSVTGIDIKYHMIVITHNCIGGIPLLQEDAKTLGSLKQAILKPSTTVFITLTRM
jgi:hypothetical protein